MIVGAAFAGLFAANPVIAATEDEGFVALFNGKDLTGWSSTGNWLVHPDGVLAIEPREGENGWQRYGAYLWTDKEYSNFILDLEYKIPENGNSGVFVGVKDKGDPVYKGIEVQILDSHGKQGKLTQHDCGGVIGIQAASENMSKPAGVWNRMVITCKNNQLQVKLNGQQIIDLNLSDRIPREKPLAGYIGLQDHGLPLQFRNIRIRQHR